MPSCAVQITDLYLSVLQRIQHIYLPSLKYNLLKIVKKFPQGYIIFFTKYLKRI